jgi:hypothetical protein
LKHRALPEWSESCGHHEESIVLRVTVLSIVLALATGPSLSVLCRVWCDQAAAPASGCHPQDDTASTRVAAGHSCPDQALSQAVMQEDLQRRISPDSRDWAAAVPRFQMTLAAFDVRPEDDAVHWRPDPDEHLSIPLRI